MSPSYAAPTPADPSTTPAAPGAGRLITGPLAALAGLLVLCGLAIVLARLHTYHEPIERDLTTYAVVGQGLLQGRPLYADLWDHKPPAIHLTYAAAQFLVGYGPAQFYFLGVGSALVTMLGLAWAGRLLTGSLAGAAWAAVIWTLVSSSLVLGANQPNTESFINALGAWSLALALWRLERPNAWGAWIGIGLLMAWGSMYKQPVVALMAPLALVHMVVGRPSRWRALADVALASLIIALAWALLFGVFALLGHLAALWETIFVFNRWYAQQPEIAIISLGPRPDGALSLLLGWPARVVRLHTYLLRDILPWLLLPAWAAMLLGLLRGPRARWAMAGGFYLACAGLTAVTVFLFPHYIQLLLAPSALAAGAGLASVGGWAPRAPQALRRSAPWVGVAAGLVIVAGLVYMQVPHFRLSPDDWSRRKYEETFIFSRDLARQVGGLLRPDEDFYMLGSHTGLYVDTGRMPPTGVFYDYPAIVGPLVAKMNDRVVRDLDRARPAMVVVLAMDITTLMPRSAPIRQWLMKNYVLLNVPTPRKEVLILGLRGGRLHREIGAAPPPASQPRPSSPAAGTTPPATPAQPLTTGSPASVQAR